MKVLPKARPDSPLRLLQRGGGSRAPRIVLILSVLSLLVPGMSRAESLDSQQRIEALYREGRSARDRGDRARALELLREAWQLRKTHDGAASLAQVEFELGLKRDAAEHLAYALEHLPAEAPRHRVQRLRDALQAVRREVVTVSLHVEPKTAEVGLNGTALGPALSLPRELFADAGRIVVSATLDGYETSIREVVAKPGEILVMKLTLKPSAPAVPAPSLPAPHSAAPLAALATSAPAGSARTVEPPRNALPVVLSATAATLAFGAGVGALLLARAREDRANERLARLPGENRCGAGTPSRQACADIREELETSAAMQGVAYGAFAGAAIGAAASVWFLSRPTAPGRSSAVKLRVRPFSLGAQALGEF